MRRGASSRVRSIIFFFSFFSERVQKHKSVVNTKRETHHTRYACVEIVLDAIVPVRPRNRFGKTDGETCSGNRPRGPPGERGSADRCAISSLRRRGRRAPSNGRGYRARDSRIALVHMRAAAYRRIPRADYNVTIILSSGARTPRPNENYHATVIIGTSGPLKGPQFFPTRKTAREFHRVN